MGLLLESYIRQVKELFWSHEPTVERPYIRAGYRYSYGVIDAIQDTVERLSDTEVVYLLVELYLEDTALHPDTPSVQYSGESNARLLLQGLISDAIQTILQADVQIWAEVVRRRQLADRSNEQAKRSPQP